MKQKLEGCKIRHSRMFFKAASLAGHQRSVAVIIGPVRKNHDPIAAAATAATATNVATATAVAATAATAVAATAATAVGTLWRRLQI